MNETGSVAPSRLALPSAAIVASTPWPIFHLPMMPLALRSSIPAAPSNKIPASNMTFAGSIKGASAPEALASESFLSASVSEYVARAYSGKSEAFASGAALILLYFLRTSPDLSPPLAPFSARFREIFSAFSRSFRYLKLEMKPSTMSIFPASKRLFRSAFQRRVETFKWPATQRSRSGIPISQSLSYMRSSNVV